MSANKNLFGKEATPSGSQKRKQASGTTPLSKSLQITTPNLIDLTTETENATLDPLSPKEPSMNTQWWEEFCAKYPGIEFVYQGETWKVYGVVDSDGETYVTYYDSTRKDRPKSVEDPGVGDFKLTDKLAREIFGHTIDGKDFLKPGDTIQYWDPIYTAGDKRGSRTTTVLEVKCTFPRLVLENNAVLEDDQSVIRMKRFHGGKSVRHSGFYHYIQEFVIRPEKLALEKYKMLGIEREADRVTKIAKKAVKRLKRDHGGDGFFRGDDEK